LNHRAKSVAANPYPIAGTWHPFGSRPALGPAAVHVWRGALDRSEAEMARLERMLAPEELERAYRFRFEQGRRHYIAARGVLRCLLGMYLARPPESLRFTYNAHGKPALLAEARSEPLCFNVSHSHALALFGVTLDREIGVDVEHIDEARACGPVAERFFSPREQTALAALPADRWPAAFFACWSRKEAYIKARGLGLSIPLDSFDVTLSPGQSAALLEAREDPGGAARWSMCALSPGEHYAGALVVLGHGWQLWCGQWPDENPAP
jgi:4'-phosphopantetheinyl transferase